MKILKYKGRLFFNTKDFINKANRKLYRTNHNMGGKLGQFFKTNAVTPLIH